MISSRKDASARVLFFVSTPTASGVQLPFATSSIWIFSTSILSFFTLLSRTLRDRRLASEIPLSTLVAVDRLTFFGVFGEGSRKHRENNQWEESNP